VDQFAYPFGSPASFTADTVRAVREAGFSQAFTTVTAAVDPSTDRLQLPRLSVSEWSGRDLVRRMERLGRLR
jgi:hypothetical protein